MSRTSHRHSREPGHPGRPVLDGATAATNSVRRALGFLRTTDLDADWLRTYMAGRVAEAADLAEGPSAYGPRYWRAYRDRMEELYETLHPSDATPLRVDALREEVAP